LERGGGGSWKSKGQKYKYFPNLALEKHKNCFPRKYAPLSLFQYSLKQA